MSKNITISEGENARAFGNTKKLKTQLQGEDAGFCFWVPEDETRANSIYISKNGLHTAKDAGEYGFSVAHVNVPSKITDRSGYDWDVDIDEFEVPHIELDDLEITIDDDIGEIIIITDDEEINIDPEDYNLDPDADIDVSIDPEDFDVDIVGMDLDGDDVMIDLDLDTGDFDIMDCPASIQIMHVPNKTAYTDGGAIDYDGLVVQAFDADGNPWTSPDYPDGYIPVHKLNLPKYSDITEADANVELPDYALIDNADSVVSIGSIIDIFQDHFPDNISEAQKETMRDGISDYVPDAAISYAWCNGDFPPAGTGILIVRWTGCVVITGQPGGNGLCDAVRYSWDLSYLKNRPEAGGDTIFNLIGPRIDNIRINLFQGYEEETGLLSNANASVGGYLQPIDIEWESPCINTISSSFNITVNPREDHGGSHHSGKF